MNRTPRIVFLAAHLLLPSIASGGDVLFCELGRRIQEQRPDWKLVALAPSFAKRALQKYFSEVATFEAQEPKEQQGSPLDVVSTWARRLDSVRNALFAVKPDLIHSTGDFFIDTVPAALVKKKIGTRWSGVVHHINPAPYERRNTAIVATGSYLLQRFSLRMMRSCDTISVLNDGVRAQLQSSGFAPGIVHVVGAGIVPEKFPLIRSGSSTRRILWLNRLEPTKGIFDLPIILKQLPSDVVIDVVGRGPEVYTEQLRKMLVRENLTDRCVLHDFLPGAALQEVFRNAHVFISCSYEEGWGISIAEALSIGLPCIVYDLPSHREIFGDTVVRVPIGDRSAFADAIVHALSINEDPELRVMRHEFAMQHSLDRCATRQEAAFADVLG